METKLGHRIAHSVSYGLSKEALLWGNTGQTQPRSKRDSLGSVSPRSKSFTLLAFLRRYYLACSWMDEGMESCEEVRLGVNFVLTP